MHVQTVSPWPSPHSVLVVTAPVHLPTVSSAHLPSSFRPATVTRHPNTAVHIIQKYHLRGLRLLSVPFVGLGSTHMHSGGMTSRVCNLFGVSISSSHTSCMTRHCGRETLSILCPWGTTRSQRILTATEIVGTKPFDLPYWQRMAAVVQRLSSLPLFRTS